MHHEAQELGRQFLVLAALDEAAHFHLHVMAFREGGRLVAIGVLGNHMIGRRGGVGQHHRRLALGEQRIGLRPARRHGEDARAQLLPGIRCLVAIDLLHPEKEA